jgi:hypothetical protein
MPSWNELHYARAEEFLRLLGKAVSGGGRGQSTAPFAPPAASAPAAPPLAPKADASATPPATAPTAAAVFKKIPWGKK